MKPYIITADLEQTWLLILDTEVATMALQKIRENTIESVNRALWTDITKIYTYKEISEWFKNISNKEKEFSISVDNGIYIKDADFYFDSTRMYNSEKSILENPNSYRIMTRSGWEVMRQYSDLEKRYKEKKVIIYDDGMFSWDTLNETIRIIQSNPRITVSEIRVVLNFSGKDNLWGIPIKAMYSGECTDWIDERDFFYGVDMWGASINENWKISGVPYISNTKLAAKKASITTDTEQFCLNILDINQDFWKIKQVSENTIMCLEQIPRLQYLKSKYNWEDCIEKVINKEKERCLSN